MRYVLSTILLCALGAPDASALPGAGALAVSMSNSDVLVQVAKRADAGSAKTTRTAKTAKAKKQDNGIHPLVGSGDY